MLIREYCQNDSTEVAALFYNTVHIVCAGDYSKSQLDAWAPETPDNKKLSSSLLEHYSLVAVKDGVIVGFGDMDSTGYLDRLYVHKDYQRMGVGTLLCDKLEAYANGNITVHASITARPFFENRGYKLQHAQQVKRLGVLLTNYVMVKYR